MKKVFKNGVMLVALLTTSLNFAAEVANTAALKYENRTGIISSKIDVGDKVVVKNHRGQLVMDAVATSSLYYEQLLKLSSLPDGSYTLEVIKDTQVNMIPFYVTEGEVSVVYELENTLFKPTVRVRDDFLYINQLSLKEAPLEIELYFKPDNVGAYSFQLIHSETINGTMKIGRIYELDKKEKGMYKLVLITEDRTYTEKFRF